MIRIKLDTPVTSWPWRRQLPENGNVWGPFHFHIDEPVDECAAWVVFESLDSETTVRCPPERTIFIAGEPSAIGRYHPSFLRQFAFVVSCNPKLKHPKILRMQQGHPWFVEKSFDELITMEPFKKMEQLCLIVSNKDFAPGHKKRLSFVEKLKSHFKDRLVVFGRGIRDFDSKWELLSRYRYTIVLENSEEEDFVTEKLPDAWLAFCFPFYAGAKNLERYFTSGSYAELDLDDSEASIAKIESLVGDAEHYDRVLPKILQMRQYYLQHYQFFPNLTVILQWVMANPATAITSVTLTPNADFFSAKRSVFSFLCESFFGVFRRFLERLTLK